jgi:hypothetical protein
MFLAYGLTETNTVSHGVYAGIMFVSSLALLVLHFYLGKKYLLTSENMILDVGSFTLITACAILYLLRTPSGVSGGPYTMFAQHYEFLDPIFGFSNTSIGVGVFLSCAVQYFAMRIGAR